MRENTAILSTGSNKPKFFYGYVVVAAAFLIMALLCGGIYSYGVFFKPISADFGWTRALTSGAHSLCMFMTGLFSLITGRMTDKLGPRIVMTICGFLFGLGYLLMSQISDVWQLYLFYGVIVGIGMSGGLVPTTSAVARWFVKRRGLMTGIVVAGVGAGTMISPPAATYLILEHGWRTSYIFIGAFFLISLILTAQLLKRDPSRTGQLPYGASEVLQANSTPEIKGASLGQATRTWQIWMLCLAYVFFGISQIAVMIHIVPHATDQGIPPMAAATIMTIIGALSLTGRIVIGSIADKIGSRWALVIGASLVTVALVLLQFAQDTWMWYLFAAIFGFGYGGEVALISPIVAEFFGLKAHGAILGVVAFLYHIGCGVGPLLVGHIFDITNSYYFAFMVCIAISVAGIILLLPIKHSLYEDLS